MIKHVYDKNGKTLLRTEEATPIHMIDFCDSCGDCLDCYGQDDCGGDYDTSHYWVEYSEEESEPKSEVSNGNS